MSLHSILNKFVCRMDFPLFSTKRQNGQIVLTKIILDHKSSQLNEVYDLRAVVYLWNLQIVIIKMAKIRARENGHLRIFFSF